MRRERARRRLSPGGGLGLGRSRHLAHNLSLTLILTLAACAPAQSETTPAAGPGTRLTATPDVTPTIALPTFVRYAQPGAIALDVPADWVTAVETADLWLFAEANSAASVNQEAEGPAFMVHRLASADTAPAGTAPGTASADQGAAFGDPTAPLDELLATWLARTPLGEGYRAVGAVQSLPLGGLDAREVMLEDSGVAPDGGQISPARRAVVTLVRSPDGAVYAVSAIAEVADWERRWPVLEAMRASLVVSPELP